MHNNTFVTPSKRKEEHKQHEKEIDTMLLVVAAEAMARFIRVMTVSITTTINHHHNNNKTGSNGGTTGSGQNKHRTFMTASDT
jgi:hypothetical protein